MERLPPSYVCDLGHGGRISCSYSMDIDVTQKSKHAFWTNRNRYVNSRIALPFFSHVSTTSSALKASWRVTVWRGIVPIPYMKSWRLLLT